MYNTRSETISSISTKRLPSSALSQSLFNYRFRAKKINYSSLINANCYSDCWSSVSFGILRRKFRGCVKSISVILLLLFTEKRMRSNLILISVQGSRALSKKRRWLFSKETFSRAIEYGIHECDLHMRCHRDRWKVTV